MFIGRERELKEIKKALSTSTFEAFLIYGRRRIGKSELVYQGIKSSKLRILSYECKRASNRFNLDLMTECLEKVFGLSNLYFKDFISFFEYVFEFSTKQEFIFVIDEFSFLVDNDPSVESFLASAIDKYKRTSKMKLFVLGSYVLLMEKMISPSSHIYGRFNHILLLKPFDYYDSSLFYPEYTDEDKIMTYAVFGGVPYFNSLIDPKKSFLGNVEDLLIVSNSILEKEIENVILTETSKINEMNEIIKVISSGVTKYSDIIAKIKEVNKRPDYLLQKLVEMDIIKKEAPINQSTNKKKMFYSFEDNLLDFYYRYIFGSISSSFRINPAFFFENFIKEDFETDYLPHKFEKVAKEFLLRKNIEGQIRPVIKTIGTYWFDDRKNKKNRQFDVVTLDALGYISYECKYTDSPIDKKVIEEEERQTRDLDIDFYKLGFISKKGYSKGIDAGKYNLFSLSDFYKR